MGRPRPPTLLLIYLVSLAFAVRSSVGRAALEARRMAARGRPLHLGSAYGSAGGAGSGIFPSFTWQLLLVPILGTVVLASGLFLWRELDTRGARLLIVAAILMFAAAVGLDFFEGLSAKHPWNPYAAIAARYDLAPFTKARFGQSPYTTLVHFSRSIEEFLEMLANTCFWSALIAHVRTTMPAIRLKTTT